MPEEASCLCKRCGRPVVENADRYDVFEGMHWLCFHLEFEHEGDPDVACKDISCPWFQIDVFRKLLRDRGIDPSQVLYKEFERRRALTSCEANPVEPPVTKHLRRICPTLLVADAAAAAGYYRDRLGFTILHEEGPEFAIVDRDGCRVILKRGTPAFNRDRCKAAMEFYDLFIHCDSMPAFDALHDELQLTTPIGLGPIESWGDMRLFPVHDLDGYKIYFARSI